VLAMSVCFDPRKRIYDLHSFDAPDAPYDLEPTVFPESLRNYEETIDSHKNFTSAGIEDEEDEFRHLELTFEEDESVSTRITSSTLSLKNLRKLASCK